MNDDKHLFLGANTTEGFVGFQDKLVDMYNLKKFYILKGGSGIGKSTFIRRFADAFPNHRKDYFVCAGDPKSLDGVILPELGIGIIDGTYPHPVDPQYPGFIDEIINLGEYIIADKLTADIDTLKELQHKKIDLYKKAYAHLSNAREVHYQIEALYKGAVDFDGINSKLSQIIMKHIDNQT